MKKFIGRPAWAVSATILALGAILSAGCGGQKTATSNLVVNPGDHVANFAVYGMTKDSCMKTVVKQLKQLPGVTDARVIQSVSTAQVSYDPYVFKPVTAEDIQGKYSYKVSKRFDEDEASKPKRDEEE